MFTRCCRRLGHPGIAAERMETWFEDYSMPPFRKRVVQRIRSWPRWKKVLYPIFTPLVTFCGYVGVCTLVHKNHRPTIDAMFDEDHAEEYLMDDWSAIEPTLREGDVVLLMGTGSMSWKITNTQFVLSGMRPAALRYSHVGVVVKPAEVAGSTFRTQSQRRLGALLPRNAVSQEQASSSTTRGAMMMEAVDNKDVKCPDWEGKVRCDCVQVVEISKRVFGKEGVRPCYHRFAVRRLQGFEWTPERREKLNQFLTSKIGQPMDKSPKLMLAFIWPRLYDALQVRQNHEISCSELIADLFKAVGIIQRRVQYAHEPNKTEAEGGFSVKEVAYDPKRSIEISPCHFAEGLERGVLDFAPGVGLGPEIRIKMPRPPQELLYTK
mmetsp:Transcript_22630/g.26243  ORF Transcript_22630/g.26243 Transcript_22630/m.26243 type:complete len:379 (+) Transcript_22630:47-1183(+)